MARLLSPDDRCVAVTSLSGRKYSGTSFEVSDPRDARALRQAGYTVADTGGVPSPGAGFQCKSCGFKAFFRRCSRCGGECERPDVVA